VNQDLLDHQEMKAREEIEDNLDQQDLLVQEVTWDLLGRLVLQGRLVYQVKKEYQVKLDRKDFLDHKD